MPRNYTPNDEPIPGYRLTKFLGRGGFGEVWKARGPGGTECALKIINLKDRQGIKEFRAIRLVKNISDPHLTPIHALWLKDQQGRILDESSGEDDSLHLKGQDVELILAMQLGSMNLLDRLEEFQNQGLTGIPVEELLDYMEDAAKGIDFLNQPGKDKGKSGRPSIQHCDIKPQNILLVGNSAQICDFGLARPLNDARKTSQAAISFAYVSPELIQEQTSRSCDQYSLGISYYELRTGALPFNSTSAADVMFSHLQGRLTFAKVPEGEQAVLKRATALNPEDRFPTCLEMVRALRRAVEGKASSGSGRGSGLVRVIEAVKPGEEVVPGYRLVRKIGRGGYGEVWEATAPGGKSVALKVIHNLDRSGARHEFRALETIKGLDHNHLMEVHAYWLLDREGVVIPDEARDRPDAPPPRTLVIATKLATKNLLERLHECQLLPAKSPGIPFDELVNYMRQAADALDYLNTPQHPLGERLVSIQHRDIKPENILLAANTVKVTDFGLAKVLEGSSAIIHGDSAGLTLHYAAPEVFLGEITARSDQYSLALTYLHLRTGVVPFASRTKAEIMRLHMEGRIDLSLLPEPERRVIARATALDPKYRFPTCMDMVKALEATAAPAAERMPVRESETFAGRKTDPVIMEDELFADLSDVMSEEKRQPAPAAELPPKKETPLPPDAAAWIEIDPESNIDIYGTVMTSPRKMAKTSPVPQEGTRPGARTGRPPFEGGKETEKPSKALSDTDPAHQALPTEPGSAALTTTPVDTEFPDEQPVVVKAWQTGAAKPIVPAKRSNKSTAVLTVGALVLVVGLGGAALYSYGDRLFGKQSPPSAKGGSGGNGTNSTATQTSKSEDTKRTLEIVGSGRLARKLTEANDSLETDPARAGALFKEAQQIVEGEKGQAKELAHALSGQARAAARLGRWLEVKQALELEKRSEEANGATAELGPLILALAALAETGSVKEKLDRLLPLHQPEDQTGALPDWERDQVRKWSQDVCKGPEADQILSETNDPGQALKIAQFILMYDNQRGVALRMRDELEAIADAKDPGKRNDAAKRIEQLLGAESQQRPVLLLKAYASLAQDDDKGRPQAVRIIEAAVKTLKKNQQDEVRPSLQLLLVREVEAMLPNLEERKDFLAARRYCQQLMPEANGRILACLAESLIVTASDSPAKVEEAQKVAWNERVASEAGLYGQFVRAAVLMKQEKFEQAIAAFDGAFARNEPWQKSRARRNLVASAYYDAGSKLAKANPLKAYPWLKKAVAFHEQASLPKEYRLTLAEAALEQKPADLACAKDESGQLLRNPGLDRLGGAAYRVLLIHARAQQGAGEQAGSLADYRKLIELWQKKRLDEVKPSQFYEEVVDRAITASKGWLQTPPEDAEVRKLVASLCAFKGRMLFHNQKKLDEEFPVKRDRRLPEAAAAYEDAARLYPARDAKLAQYLVWQGYLLIQLSWSNIDKVEALANKAKEIASTYYGSHFLDGLTRHYNAVVTSDIKLALDLEDQAVKELDTAIQDGEGEDPQPELLHVFYQIRSAANVLRANYLHDLKGIAQRSTYTAYLERARDDALRIKELKPEDLTYAYLQLGNAYEDLAWICKQEAEWDLAADAFSKAIEASHELDPVPWIGRGRTSYKRFEADKKVAHLPAAESDLKKALKLVEAGDKKDEEGECRTWLALTQLHLGKYPEATAMTERAIKAVTGGWLPYVRQIIREELSKAWECAYNVRGCVRGISANACTLSPWLRPVGCTKASASKWTKKSREPRKRLSRRAKPTTSNSPGPPREAGSISSCCCSGANSF